MRLNKIINCRIYSISCEELEDLLDKKVNNICYECTEKQSFIVHTNRNTYIACDNTTGECYVAEFNTQSAAYIFLTDLALAEPLHAAEETEGWY